MTAMITITITVGGVITIIITGRTAITITTIAGIITITIITIATMTIDGWLGGPFLGMRTVMLSDEPRNQFRHNSPAYARELRRNLPETQGVANENVISAVHVYYFDIRLGWRPR
jgi:hypothetical protein